MSAGKDIKREQAKIEGIESKALPFNENEYQEIADTLVNPSKIQLTNPNNLELNQQRSIGQVELPSEPEPNEPETPNGDEEVTDNEDPAN
jgi:hypothetical protein